MIYYEIKKNGSEYYSKPFLKKPECELHQVYRALEVLAKENDFFQSQLYKNTEKMMHRQKEILFYDCTNYYFEIEEEDSFRKYWHSKEHRPNPIVQMGLFMDADGIPLTFSVFNGNDNEQPSMRPLENKILSNFGLKKFIVCTDAGLSTTDGEVADHLITSIDDEVVREEEQYDGFYAVCTNLEDDVSTIISINQKRWQIKECFRIMKSEFQARPVYLSREDRITDHFITCCTVLIIYRILEKKLGEDPV